MIFNRRNFIQAAAIIAGHPRAALGESTPVPQEFIHPEWFADPAWLASHLNDGDLRVIALTATDDFSAGHIPGSSQIDWPALEASDTTPTGLTTWQSSMADELTLLGVSNQGTVVVYDGGTFWAARLWWVLYILGHDDVRILDGGLPAWVASGGELESGEPRTKASENPFQTALRARGVVTIDQAVAAVAEGSSQFVDARSSGEFAEGHIPGAVNIPYTENATDSGYWKSPDDLAALYASAGLVKGNRIIPYCSSGVRSAVTYFALRQLGFEDTALFTGSFDEWSSDPARPVERS